MMIKMEKNNLIGIFFFNLPKMHQKREKIICAEHIQTLFQFPKETSVIESAIWYT